MRWISWAVVATVLLEPARATGFSYPEHVALTAEALARLRDEVPRAEGVLSSVAELAAGPWCAGHEFLGGSPGGGCFALADLAALGGDHAAHPAALLARFFLDDAAEQALALRALEEARTGEERDAALGRPESCGFHAPRVRDFLSALRGHGLSGGARVDLGGLDLALADADPDYICLAQRGAGHFRIPGVPPVEAAGLSSPNAVASYGAWHREALALAALGRDLAAGPGRLLALAVLYELVALHFLEDAVAAGHMVAPFASLPLDAVRATHDHYNHRGLRVRIPDALCAAIGARRAWVPRLSAACAGAAGGRVATVRGDEALAAGAVRDDPGDVTRDVAALVALASLRELVEVPARADGCFAPVAEACARGPALACLAAWSASACRASARVGGASLAAAAMLPVPGERAAPRGGFTGTTTTLGVSTRGFAWPVAGGAVASAMVFTLALGTAWYSPAFWGHQVGVGAELVSSLAVARATAQVLPSLLGARGWITYALAGASGGRPVYVGAGLSLEALQGQGPRDGLFTGVGLGLSLVPVGITLESTDRAAVRAQVLLDGLVPLAGGGDAALLVGLGVLAALR